MKSDKSLETEHLLMRMFRADDFEAYARIFANPEVTQYLGDGKPLNRWEAWRNMVFHIGHWSLRGYGMWAVEEKTSGQLIGRVGFFNPEGWPAFEVGWALAREFWGRGYATESARRVLAYAFTEMGRAHVISVIDPENQSSIKVAERLGERFERKVDLFGREMLIYGIDRRMWCHLTGVSS